MKLGKTEQYILNQMKKNRHGVYSYTLSSGRGRGGGMIKHGQRESNACQSLQKKGLASHVKTVKSQETYRGWTIHSYDVTYKITDRGEKY